MTPLTWLGSTIIANLRRRECAMLGGAPRGIARADACLVTRRRATAGQRVASLSDAQQDVPIMFVLGQERPRRMVARQAHCRMPTATWRASRAPRSGRVRARLLYVRGPAGPQRLVHRV